MITLAFYKGVGKTPQDRFVDFAIRFATRSRYSHVELIPGRAEPGKLADCLGSSAREGCVRRKTISLKPEHWDLVYLDESAADAERFITRRVGARYDYLGIILSHMLALNRHSKRSWFCSEICAAALGFKDPHRISPQMLYDMISWKYC